MSGPPFDWETDDSHPWLWDFDTDTLDWSWPTSIYDPCPMGCHLGSVRWGDSFWMTCPYCAGAGIGEAHEC